jgi:formate dehydrogenase subunit gamma
MISWSFQKQKRVLRVGQLSLLIGIALITLYTAITLAQSVSNTLPLHDFWSTVREGPQELVGMTFRDFREEFLKTFGGWLFAVVILIFGAHYLIFGPHRYADPGMSPKMFRFTIGERTLHWFVAISFVILALSGLTLLYGKYILTPVLGKSAFSSLAYILKLLHNFLGPAFVVAVILLVANWWRDGAVFRDHDIEWFKKGGGYFGKDVHAPAGRFSAGQKLWFWAVILFGLATAGTGLILDFSNFLGNLWGLQTDVANKNILRYALIIHETVTVLFVAGLFGHVYMGAFAQPGALGAMLRGEVEENWAKEHHSVWYEEQKGK